MATTSWLPDASTADVRFAAAVRLTLLVASGAVNAGFCAGACGQAGQFAPSVRLIGGDDATCALKAAGVPAATVTPAGRKLAIGIFNLPLSGTGRFHVVSQLGASVGIAQAASSASAKIPTSGRRMKVRLKSGGVAAR